MTQWYYQLGGQVFSRIFHNQITTYLYLFICLFIFIFTASLTELNIQSYIVLFRGIKAFLHASGMTIQIIRASLDSEGERSSIAIPEVLGPIHAQKCF